MKHNLHLTLLIVTVLLCAAFALSFPHVSAQSYVNSLPNGDFETAGPPTGLGFNSALHWIPYHSGDTSDYGNVQVGTASSNGTYTEYWGVDNSVGVEMYNYSSYTFPTGLKYDGNLNISGSEINSMGLWSKFTTFGIFNDIGNVTFTAYWNDSSTTHINLIVNSTNQDFVYFDCMSIVESSKTLVSVSFGYAQHSDSPYSTVLIDDVGVYTPYVAPPPTPSPSPTPESTHHGGGGGSFSSTPTPTPTPTTTPTSTLQPTGENGFSLYTCASGWLMLALNFGSLIFLLATVKRKNRWHIGLNIVPFVATLCISIVTFVVFDGFCVFHHANQWDFVFNICEIYWLMIALFVSVITIIAYRKKKK